MSHPDHPNTTVVAGDGPVPGPAPARPARQPGGFGRGFGMGLGLAVGAGLVALVLAVISGVVFVAGLAALGSATSSAATDTTETTLWGDPGATHRIQVVTVAGPILGSSTGDSAGSLFGAATYGYDVAAEIDALEKGDADALILELDTPGGTIYGSRAISDAVERYRERTDQPVVAYVRGISASGGMYAMAGADEILVDHGTVVGSIGVIMGPLPRYRDVKGTTGTLLEEGVQTDGGITEEYFTRGTGKDLGNPYRDLTPEERANIDAWLDAEYTAFVDHVSARRNLPAERIRGEFGAFTFGPQAAIGNGLADQELGQDEAYRHVAELAGIDPDDTKVVTQSEPGFASLLLGARSGAPAPDAEAARRELAASPLCTGEPVVLALHGNLGSFCS